MRTSQRIRRSLLVISLLFISTAMLAGSDAPAQPPAQRDGQHDFDFEVGTWRIHLKKRMHQLAGTNDWVEFDGTSVTRKLWGGRSQIEQFETDSPSGHIEGMTLRLYNPESHEWRLYWANSSKGIVDVPQVGQFKDGQGEFYAQDTVNGKTIFIRFIWSKTNTNIPHFEQSFSDDGGKTWEVNWITDQTRISEEDFKKQAEQTTPKLDPQAPQAQHDFDFEGGTWKVQLKRLQQPLSGSDTWIDYEGTSVVKQLWNGRANIGELEIGNANTHIEGLTLRLYNPQTHQWRLYWANSKDGLLSVPTIGQWENGRGEFIAQEDFQGRSILDRFTFSDVAAASFKTEQSFSADAGKTWEPNWLATFTKE